MWTRKELKEKAKVVLKQSYWKLVLVSLILTLVTGGLGAGSSIKNNTSTSEQSYNYSYSNDMSEMQDYINEMHDDMHELKENADMLSDVTGNSKNSPVSIVFMTTVLIGVLIVMLIVMAISLSVSIFIFNPFIVGIRRFFSKEMNESTKVKEIAFAFDHSYKNIIKTMFFKDLYTFLWTLLFIIPGIVKAYEYRMIPYILGENPDMSKEEAFARSKEMMNGQKWNAFVLDLSFIGWNILSVFTFFMLTIFYVAPYKNLTDAELYNTLSGKYSNTVIDNELPMYDSQS